MFPPMQHSTISSALLGRGIGNNGGKTLWGEYGTSAFEGICAWPLLGLDGGIIEDEGSTACAAWGMNACGACIGSCPLLGLDGEGGMLDTLEGDEGFLKDELILIGLKI
jgi:hypothetical protein